LPRAQTLDAEPEPGCHIDLRRSRMWRSCPGGCRRPGLPSQWCRWHSIRS